jgi:hypothetical protein
MEIEARGVRGGFPWYLVESVIGDLFRTWKGDAAAPAVVVRAPSGREQVLLHTGSYRQAVRAAQWLREELRREGDAEFCRRYKLPESFMD